MAQPRVSSHYLGDAGEQYAVNRQSPKGGLGYKIDADFFLPHVRNDDVVLDFGCGQGALTQYIKPHVSRLDGLEVNPAAAQRARELVGINVVESLDALPGEPTYDVVYTNHVLEHVRDVAGTLEAIRPSIKIGGKLIAKLPFNDINDPYHRRWSEDDVDFHLQTWTPRLFANTLIEAGYKVVDVKPLTFAWHPKLFGISRVLGNLPFRVFAAVKRRRQIFAIARRDA